MATLGSDPATYKEESLGLVAHQHVILQNYLAKELSSAQALRHDQDFWEWTAGRDIIK